MAAEEHAAEHALTAGEYIGHHLKHLRSAEQTGVIDMSVLNLDSIFWSVLLGCLGLFFMWRVAKSVTSGVPGRMQAAVEILLELVDTQAKGIIHNAESRKFVGPLALTVFVWVFLMNSMDFLPVDLLPKIWEFIYGAAGHDTAHAYMRVVPTADLSTTLGLSSSVLLVCLYCTVVRSCGGGYGVGDIPHLDRCTAGLYFHDADLGVRGSSPRPPLRSGDDLSVGFFSFFST